MIKEIEVKSLSNMKEVMDRVMDTSREKQRKRSREYYKRIWYKIRTANYYKKRSKKLQENILYFLSEEDD